MKADVKRKYYFESINFPVIIEKFQSVDEQDRPDGIILVDDIVYMVEHFQISPYLTEQGDDMLQKSMKSNNTKKLGNEVSLINSDDNWEDCLLENWLTAFLRNFTNHMSKYQEYVKNAKDRYPDKPCKLLIVVEDNSNSVVTDKNLCILDILEFVEKILSYPQIDGVITFKTSPLGDSVVAKDRTQLEADKEGGKLKRMAYCDFMMLLEKVGGIQGLTVEDRMSMKDQIFHFLANLKETAVLEDSIQVEKYENSGQQSYEEMIHSIVVPATLSQEEMLKCYQPLTSFLQTEVPEKLYRFRRCDEKSISAFDQDQLWFSPGCKMNDDFDALLHFDKETIKTGLKAALENQQFLSALESIGQGTEIPPSIQNQFPAEMLDSFRKTIASMDQSTLIAALKQFYNFFANQIDINDITVQQVIRKTIKFACFSEEIGSAAMWGYYADSGRGFALSYDFRNGNYTKCNACPTRTQCPKYKNCLLMPVIYGDNCFDATQYATWLFQQEAIQKMLADRNILPLYPLSQNISPCPDLFMANKILLHKASAWSHEREWRLTCQCNSPEFNTQEFSCAEKKPTAVYLGQNISLIYEKILRHIAVDKGIPVYKMQIQQDSPLYKLYPEKIS